MTGKAQADAAAACKVKVFVFSTLEDVDRRSKASQALPCSLTRSLLQSTRHLHSAALACGGLQCQPTALDCTAKRVGDTIRCAEDP